MASSLIDVDCFLTLVLWNQNPSSLRSVLACFWYLAFSPGERKVHNKNIAAFFLCSGVCFIVPIEHVYLSSQIALTPAIPRRCQPTGHPDCFSTIGPCSASFQQPARFGPFSPSTGETHNDERRASHMLISFHIRDIRYFLAIGICFPTLFIVVLYFEFPNILNMLWHLTDSVS